jgi:beta-lactamase class D/beta-lactamase class D OXA-48
MWLVGYVVKDKKPFFYAMNFISDDFDRGAPARSEILQDILKHLGVTTAN